MPRQTFLPSYRLHKARNCAVVTIRGRNFYLGKYDSPESKEEYGRLIAEHFGSGGPPAIDPTTELTAIAQLRQWVQ